MCVVGLPYLLHLGIVRPPKSGAIICCILQSITLIWLDVNARWKILRQLVNYETK
jgi:hypothetical protein